MRRSIGFGFLLLGAAMVVACSQQASNGTLVPSAGPGAKTARHHPTVAHLSLVIPSRARARRARYVSPGTASIAVVVRPAASAGVSPTPMPAQYLDVAAPACVPVRTDAFAPRAGRPALVCRFDVEVMPGRDAFALTAYAKKNGQGSVLSAYDSKAELPIPTSGALYFTLEGRINSVIISDPGTSQQLVPVPIGASTSTPIEVVPVDAAGYVILSQYSGTGPVPYLAPVTVSVSPASAGVTLSNDRGSGSKVTIANPNDLALEAVYDGSVRFSGNAIVGTTYSLAAAVPGAAPVRYPRMHPDESTPAPNAAEIALASNALPYAISSPSAGASAFPGGLAYRASTNTFTYAVDAGTQSKVGTFALHGSTFSSTSETLPFTAYQPFVDSLGGTWFLGGAGDSAVCYKQLTSASPDASVTMTPSGFTSAVPQGMTQDSSGTLWIASWDNGYESSWIGTNAFALAAECQPGAPSIGLYNFGGNPPNAAAPAPQSGAPGIWANSEYQALLLQADPAPSPSSVPSSSPAPTTSPPTYAYATNVSVLGLDAAPGGSVYALASDGKQNFLEQVGSGGTLSSVGSIPLTYPESPIFQLTSALRALYVDSNGGIDLFDPPSGDFLPLGMPLDVSGGGNPSCEGSGFDATETPWVLCSRSDNSVVAYRVLLTSTWSVFPPSVSLAVEPGCAGAGFAVPLGIGEALPQNSGPFTMTSSNSTLVQPLPTDSSDPHQLEIDVTGYAGSATVDVTDQHQRSVAVPVFVSYSSNGMQCGAGRGARRSTAKHSRIPRPGWARSP